MDLIDGLRAFVATAQTGSFTEAAERMGVSNRLTSIYVAELETRIGARLLQRTTRKVGLTSTGQDLLARAPALLDELDDMLGSITEESKGFSGTIRISAPVTFGEVYIKDLLDRFTTLHPNLSIDLRLNDAFVDLAANGFDLAFRIGIPEASSLKMRKLGIMKSLVVASPEYLAEYGTPRTPQELEKHQCIADTNHPDINRWVFKKGDEEFTATVSRQFMVNSARVTRDWAAEGRGIAYCPDFVLSQHLADGRLVRLLEDFETQSYPIAAMYLEGNVLPRKVRALIDFALEDFQTSSH